MPRDIQKQFGKNLKARRKELGLTLEQVAEDTGSSKSHIWSVEENKTNVGLSKALIICARLGVTIDQLLENETAFSPDVSRIATDIENLLKSKGRAA